MRRFLRAAILAAVAGAIGTGVYVGLTLPPLSHRLPTPLPPAILYGAYHVHSDRSDGSGNVDAIAAAAARAGLAFVVFTDHGDATRPPDPPAYRHGVLCLDGVEISTASGHVVALGLRRVADYPLAGEARDVIEDIHRLGGWAIAAHPDSPREELRWRSPAVGVDGLEWINVDSEWRDEPLARLAGSALRALVRPSPAIATLFERPARTLARWDTALRSGPVAGLAAVDAHARIGWDTNAAEPPAGGLRFPGYEAMFGTVAQAAVLDKVPTGDPHADAAAIVEALVTGRSYSIVRAFAHPASLTFLAERRGVQAGMGGSLDGPGSATVRADVLEVPGARVTLLRDGRQVAEGQGSLEIQADAAGVYRVEVAYAAFGFPWIVSNAIRIGLAPVEAPPSTPPLPTGKHVPAGVGVPWAVEHDASSTGSVATEGGELRLQYQLGPGPPSGQYTAFVTTVSGDAALDRVRFRARADRPMRLSLQVRVPGGGPDGRRWRRSIYVDTTPRLVDVPLSELEPVGPATALRPISARVQAVLVVVDTLNTRPGEAGAIWLSEVALGLGDIDGRRR